MSDVTQTYRDSKKDSLQKMIFPGLILHGRQRYSSFPNRGFPNENRMFPHIGMTVIAKAKQILIDFDPFDGLRGKLL